MKFAISVLMILCSSTVFAAARPVEMATQWVKNNVKDWDKLSFDIGAIGQAPVEGQPGVYEVDFLDKDNDPCYLRVILVNGAVDPSLSDKYIHRGGLNCQ